jgi:hypothetical protein
MELHFKILTYLIRNLLKNCYLQMQLGEKKNVRRFKNYKSHSICQQYIDRIKKHMKLLRRMNKYFCLIELDTKCQKNHLKKREYPNESWR